MVEGTNDRPGEDREEPLPPPGYGPPPAQGPGAQPGSPPPPPPPWPPPGASGPPPGASGPPPGASGPPPGSQPPPWPPPPPGSQPPPWPPPPGSYPYGYEWQRRPVDAFGRPLADWWRRAVALIVDALILSVPGVAVIVGVVLAGGFTNTYRTYPNGTTVVVGNGNTHPAAVLAYILVGVVGLAYFTFFYGSERGQTLGMMAIGISVCDSATGRSIGYWRGLVRILLQDVLAFICFIPAVLNYLWPLWDPRRQCWHDKAVDSVVIEAR